MSELLDAANKLGLKCPICQSNRAYIATDSKHQFAYCITCKIKLEPQVALDKEVVRGRRQESQNDLLELFSRNFRKIGIVIVVIAISVWAKTSLDSREASRNATVLGKEACGKWPTFTGIEYNDEASINEASTLFSDAADLDSKYTGVSGGAWRVSSFIHDREKYINLWGALNDFMNYSPNHDYGNQARAEVRESMAAVANFCKSEGWPMNESNPIPEISAVPSPVISTTPSSQEIVPSELVPDPERSVVASPRTPVSFEYPAKYCVTTQISYGGRIYEDIFAAGNVNTTCEMVTPFIKPIFSGAGGEISEAITANVLVDPKTQTYKDVTLYWYGGGPNNNIVYTYASRKPGVMKLGYANYEEAQFTEKDIIIFWTYDSY